MAWGIYIYMLHVWVLGPLGIVTATTKDSRYTWDPLGPYQGAVSVSGLDPIHHIVHCNSVKDPPLKVALAQNLCVKPWHVGDVQNSMYKAYCSPQHPPTALKHATGSTQLGQ